MNQYTLYKISRKIKAGFKQKDLKKIGFAVSKTFKGKRKVTVEEKQEKGIFEVRSYPDWNVENIIRILVYNKSKKEKISFLQDNTFVPKVLGLKKSEVLAIIKKLQKYQYPNENVFNCLLNRATQNLKEKYFPEIKTNHANKNKFSKKRFRKKTSIKCTK